MWGSGFTQAQRTRGRLKNTSVDIVDTIDFKTRQVLYMKTHISFYFVELGMSRFYQSFHFLRRYALLPQEDNRHEAAMEVREL